jgi:hypothetical protein
MTFGFGLIGAGDVVRQSYLPVLDSLAVTPIIESAKFTKVV